MKDFVKRRGTKVMAERRKGKRPPPNIGECAGNVVGLLFVCTSLFLMASILEVCSR